MPRPNAFGTLRLIAVATALLAAACGSTHNATKPPAGGRNMSWIISGDELAALRVSNAGLARRFFDNPRTFVIGTIDNQDRVPAGYQARPALLYTSLAKLRKDVTQHRIGDTVHAILYDPEHWSKTPSGEQRDPPSALGQFFRLAHSGGYEPIAAPGRDLTLSPIASCQKRRGEVLDRAFLRCGLPRAANGASLLVIQTAPVQSSICELRVLLRGASNQLAQPAPRLIATLSSDPGGTSGKVWPATLLAATRAMLAYVQGLMLNFSLGQVSLLADYLRDLERLGHVGPFALPGSGRDL